MDVEIILKYYNKLSDFARIMGIDYAVLYSWRRRNKIPQEHEERIANHFIDLTNKRVVRLREQFEGIIEQLITHKIRPRDYKELKELLDRLVH